MVRISQLVITNNRKDNNYIENSNFKIINESNNNKTTMGFFDSSWYQRYREPYLGVSMEIHRA